MIECRYLYWIKGNCKGLRRLVAAEAILTAFAACDSRCRSRESESMSVFWFADDFRSYLNEYGSVRNFDGVVWSPYLWFDIDREGDLATALADTRPRNCVLVWLANTTPTNWPFSFRAVRAFISGFLPLCGMLNHQRISIQGVEIWLLLWRPRRRLVRLI